MEKVKKGKKVQKPEKVKVFYGGLLPREEFEDEYAKWMAENDGKIVVIDRRFSAASGSDLATATLIATPLIAVFYREK